MRIALVQKKRFTHFDRDFELPCECAALLGRRGEIAVIVESTFTDCDDERVLRECFEARGFGGVIECVVRMTAGRRKRDARGSARDRQRFFAAGE